MSEAGEGSRLYLDAAATTPPSSTVLEAMQPHLGSADRSDVAGVRERIAAALGVTADRLSLVSGGTAANNLALLGAARSLGPCTIVSQPTEHPSVIESLRALEQRDYRVEWLPVSKSGRIDPSELRGALKDRTKLVSIMYANHETGVVQPVDEVAEACREAGVLLHVDAVQGFRTCPGSVRSLDADLVTISGHKLCGPKGVGAVARSVRAPLLPDDSGVSFSAAVGLAVALEAPHPDADALAASRDALEAGILEALSGVLVLGADVTRLPGHLALALRGVSGEAVVLGLDGLGVAVSSGAACASGSGRPSPVLLAMGYSEACARSSLRLSLVDALAPDDLVRVVRSLRIVVGRLRGLAAYAESGDAW